MKHAAPEPEALLHQACAAAGGVGRRVRADVSKTSSRVTKGRARTRKANGISTDWSLPRIDLHRALRARTVVTTTTSLFTTQGNAGMRLCYYTRVAVLEATSDSCQDY